MAASRLQRSSSDVTNTISPGCPISDRCAIGIHFASSRISAKSIFSNLPVPGFPPLYSASDVAHSPGNAPGCPWGYVSSMAWFFCPGFSGGEASAGLQQRLQECSNCSKEHPCLAPLVFLGMRPGHLSLVGKPGLQHGAHSISLHGKSNQAATRRDMSLFAKNI